MMPIRDLNALNDHELENLAFDLLQSAGVQRLVWRTPGADGGRDLEGTISVRDFTGYLRNEAWYIECKRYQASIDWPTIYNKIAHADAAGADFLLLFTNSNPSPTCETRIAEWNASSRRTKVRAWRGYELSLILRSYPLVAMKYGLLAPAEPMEAEFGTLLLQLSKTVQAAYAANELGQDPEAPLCFGASLAEFVSEKADQLRTRGNVYPLPDAKAPDYLWLDWEGPSQDFDGSGLRVLLSGLRLLSGGKRVRAISADNTVTISIEAPRLTVSDDAVAGLTQACSLCNLQLSATEDGDWRVSLATDVGDDGER